MPKRDQTPDAAQEFSGHPDAFAVPVPDDVRAAMHALAREAKRTLPDGWGFAMLAFAYNEPATMYVSTANRGDMVRALGEFVERMNRQGA